MRFVLDNLQNNFFLLINFPSFYSKELLINRLSGISNLNLHKLYKVLGKKYKEYRTTEHTVNILNYVIY